MNTERRPLASIRALQPWSAAMRLLLGVLVGLVVGTGCLGALATAGDTTDPTIPKMKVTLGVDGLTDVAGPSLLTVVVTAPAALRGSVAVVLESTTVRRDIELAAGTSKTVRIVIPAGIPEFPVTLFDGDSVVSTTKVAARQLNDGELVAVLPGATASVAEVPRQVALAPGLGNAQITSVDADVVALGSSALAQFDVIVATSADVNTSPQITAMFAAWVARGGTLVFLDPSTTRTARFPAELRPEANGYTPLSLGMVIAADPPSSSSSWAELVTPSAKQTLDHPDQFTDPSAASAAAPNMLRRAGIRLPTLGRVIIPLAIYLVLASLGTFLVLRRLRRMTAGWLVIPALAVVTSVVIALTTAPDRASSHQAIARLVDCTALACTEQRTTLLTSRDGATTEIALSPDGALGSTIFGSMGSIGASMTLTADGSDQRLTAQLQPGEATMVTTTGLIDESASLSVTATVNETTISGSVTNRSGIAVKRVIAVVGGAAADLGDLAPGATASFTLQPLGAAGEQASDDSAWGTTAFSRFADPFTDQALAGSLWAQAGGATNLVGSGTVRVAGWIPGADSAVPDTLTSTSTRLNSPPGTVPAMSVRLTTVRSGLRSGVPGPNVFRADLPASWTPSTPLVIESPQGHRLDVLVNGEWKSLPMAAATPIPAAAIRHGSIVIRDTSAAVNLGRLDLPIVSQASGAST